LVRNASKGLTWIILRQVPPEFGGVIQQIAARIGEVLDSDPNNRGANDPRFCVSLQSSQGWEQSVIVTSAITKKKTTILIDYNHLPIRCKFCFNTSHCVKECPNRCDIRRPKTKNAGTGGRKGGREGPMNISGNQAPEPRHGEQLHSSTIEVDGWTTLLPRNRRGG
jgi:hypothetical protein